MSKNVASHRSALLFLAVLPCALASLSVSVLILVACTGFEFPELNPKKPSRMELAKSAPRIQGLTVDEAMAAFPGSNFAKHSDESADRHTHILNMGESSVTTTIVAYSPNAVASVSIEVYRPGHARGRMLDQLAGEYLPRLFAVQPDGAEREQAQRWLRENFLAMSSSGHNAETTIGNTVYTLNVIRSRATLRMTPSSH